MIRCEMLMDCRHAEQLPAGTEQEDYDLNGGNDKQIQSAVETIAEGFF